MKRMITAIGGLLMLLCLGLGSGWVQAAPETRGGAGSQPVTDRPVRSPVEALTEATADDAEIPPLVHVNKDYPIPMSAVNLPRGGKVVIVNLDGEINDLSARGMIRRLEEAKAMGASHIVLVINTYGGMLGSTLEMTQYLRRMDVPVTAFVQQKAYSAGSIIAVSCRGLVMQDGSVIGDAAPISSDGRGLLPTERAKAVSPIIPDLEASAQLNGYDLGLLRSLIIMEDSVYAMTRDGKIRFVDSPEQATALAADGWAVPQGFQNPIDGKDTLLTIGSAKAQAIGLSAGTYSSPEQFVSSQGLVLLGTLSEGFGEKILGWLGSQIVRTILIVVFMQSIYIAFTHPGTGAPEAVAAISLVILLGVPLMTGFAGWLEILAIVLGLALLAVELFVIPGFGVTGIVGIVLLLGGLVMTFVPPEPKLPGMLPSFSGTWVAMQQGLVAVVGALTVSVGLWFILARYLPRLPLFGRLILASTQGDMATATGTMAVDPPSSSRTSASTVGKSSPWPVVGAIGRAMTDLKPGGTVQFIDDATGDWRSADAVSDSGYVANGAQVKVLELRGGYVVVRDVTGEK